MNKILKVLAGLVVVLLVAALVLSLGKQPQPFPEGTESAARLLPGPLQVHSHHETFVDTSRPTQANGDYPGADSRTLVSTIWHPADNSAGPYPLIVYSHGFSSMKEGGEYLGEQLASLGYVVISANFPLTHFDAPGGPLTQDVVNQPADVSFMIDRLLEQTATTGHMLEGMVDESRIGVTGISMGGMTSTLVAYHESMMDKRVTAALSIAGPTSSFTDAFYSFREIPFLMLAGDIDALVPYASNAQPVPTVVAGSQLVTVAGASHTGFSGPAAPLRWLNNPDSIGCYTVKDNVDMAMEEPWFDLLGTPEQGINYEMINELGKVDPLPPAMNILRQHMITSVVVSSFFQSQFAVDAETRAAAQHFLSEVIGEELAEVSYEAASL
jgi:predicted dienelactone hydrolase